MSDPGALPLGLQQQEAARKIDPEQLELMGKRAAAMYGKCGTPLSEAVVTIVKEARLAPEQVKRVCEFANTAAYLDEFEKAGEVRNVEFTGGLADPGAVLKDLNDGSAPAIHQADSGDYAPPGGSYKTASADISLLAEAFGHAGSMEKTASVGRDHFSRENPAEAVNDLRVTMEGARSHLMSKLSSSELVFNEVKTLLKEAAAEAVLQGIPMGDIVRAWSNYGDANQIKEAAAMVRDHLRERRILGSEQFAESLSKTASQGVVSNTQHPLVDNFLMFTKIAFEHAKLEEAVRMLGERLGDVRSTLRGML
jgi:hypothetical protein